MNTAHNNERNLPVGIQDFEKLRELHFIDVDKTEYVYKLVKRDMTADEALAQIDDKSYTLPFAADNRRLFKIGVSFDSEKRILSDWKVAEEDNA